MTLFQKASGYNWDEWCMGIFRSITGGGANGVLSGLLSMGIDPQHFNLVPGHGLGHELSMMVGSFVLSSIVGMLVFLKTHEGPDKITTEVKQTTTLTQTTQTTKDAKKDE